MYRLLIFYIFMSLALGGRADEFAKKIGESQSEYKVRILQGWGYYNSLQKLALEGDHDRFGGIQEFGISIEKYLARELWGKDIELSLQLGYIRHDEAEFNSGINQYNLGLKAYWTRFPWSEHVRTKFFATMGLSYTDDILELEEIDSDEQSKLLCYLEFGLGFNLGDLTTLGWLERFYFGGGVTHRSGAFGLFNGVHGGSNYPMIFLEMEF